MPITVGEPIDINGVIYDVKKTLGVGGLSRVYLAVNHHTGEKVAIKSFMYAKFFDKFTHENDCEDYWENEVLNTKAQARSGKHSVKVLDYQKKIDLQTPEFYIVLNFIEGMTFQDWYRKFVLTCHGLKHLDLSSVVRYIFLPLAEHLEYCHNEEFIIHRDFSVRNIIIQATENDFWPVLIDWGMSKYIGDDWVDFAPKPYCTEDIPRDITIKQKGAPPEIRFGYMPIPASDIYYLGHLMYFVFTGGIMREDSELNTRADYVLEPKKANHYLPDEYNDVVIKLTQYEPADRPRSMTQVIKMLKELININTIHFDFELFMSPDTHEITGESLDLKEDDQEEKKTKTGEQNSEDKTNEKDQTDSLEGALISGPREEPSKKPEEDIQNSEEMPKPEKIVEEK